MMSDELGDKLQQIIKMLGQDDSSDKLKEIVSVLASSLGKSEYSESSAQAENSDVTDKEGREDSDVPAKQDANELINAAKRAIEKINTNNDPRINLLRAIKPFMSQARQKKISNCIQLLQIASLRNFLTEHENEVR